MNELPFFSIITPVYNTEKYLKECIESVRKQTYSLWELILIDDGSSDNSGNICDYYAELDNRITVIHKENTGQYDSRRCGINAAKGRYCTGLDSDDYYDIDCLQKIHDAIEQSQCDVVSWNIRLVGDINKECRSDLQPYMRYLRQEYILDIIKDTNYSFCNKAFKTEYLKSSLNMGAPNNVRMAEDYMLIIGAICMTEYIYVIDSVLYNYRQYAMSISCKYSSDFIKERIEASEFVRKQLIKYELWSLEIEKAEMIAVLRHIGYCLEQVFMKTAVTKTECRQIHSKSFYRDAVKYEKRNFFDFETFLVLKLFRIKCYFLINTLMFIKKLKRKLQWNTVN